MADTSPKIRVAVLGGGLAGAALFRGLSKHGHLRVDIFESAPAFREKGQAIGFNYNGLAALRLLGLKGCLDAAGAIELNDVRIMMGEGPDSGRHMGNLAPRPERTHVTHRHQFLMEMFKGVDEGALHPGKKLARLEQADGSGEITLFFEDETTFVCDVLLGADGIHSKTRRYVIGHDNPAADPVNSGWRAAWTLQPYERALQYLGPELIDKENPAQWAWVGRGSFVMHDILANGTLVQCVISEKASDDFATIKDEWVRDSTKQHLQKVLENWDPRLKNGMVDLVTNEGKEKVQQVYHWYHRPIDTFANGAIAIVGDAAGATTPFQGSGGGMAMEDAYLLSELFEQVKNISEATAALKAYDHVQRPRRLRLIQSSHAVGMIMTGADPEVGNDGAKVMAKLAPMWDFILDVDLKKNRQDALDFLNQEARKG